MPLTSAGSTLDPRLPLDTILHADCRTALAGLPDAGVDLVFADPPYNLRFRKPVSPQYDRVPAVDDPWVSSNRLQTAKSSRLAGGYRRVLKPDGALWVIGSSQHLPDRR
jgi:modification methylase